MLAEIYVAIRRLAKSPLFTATALGTLALCIGANLTIFAVVDALLIRSLPFPDADRLVTMYYVYPKLPSSSPGASITNYFERKGKIPALSSIAAINEIFSVVGESGSTAIVAMGKVTPEFFSTLGVTPLIGRAFTDAEMTYQTDHEAILSYEYWRTEYNADPGAIGRTIRIDGDAKKIVGVLPPHFRFPSFDAPVYTPLSSDEAQRSVASRHVTGMILIGRIAKGNTLAAVQTQVDALDAALAPEFPDAKLVAEAGTHTVVAPLQAAFVASVRPMLLLLQAAALVLLLIGCANLVNLLLIRASNRSREVAIRQALGAGRRQVIRDAMTETMMLTLAGAVIGLWIGYAGISILGRLGVDQLPLGAEIVFNGRLAVAALIGAVVIGASVAVPVSWFNLSNGLAFALKSEARGGTAGSAALRLRRAFIVAQIALAFVLLTGASLLGISLRRAMAVSPGFTAGHIITGQFNLTWNGYPQRDTLHNFFGIPAVGAISALPVVGPGNGDVVTVPGYTPPRGETGLLVHDQIGVAGDYFAAMGIPLVSGRFLRPVDATQMQMTCVVDESFARHYWPEGGAVGKEVYFGTNPPPDAKYYTIVGVVGAVKQNGITETVGRGTVYVPYSRVYFHQYYLVARTSLAPEGVANLLVSAVRAADSDVPLTNLHSMQYLISDSLSTRRSPALMAGIFASSALLLATIGLYGIMAYAVAQRTREFGVRLALGAQKMDVLRLVLMEGAKLAALGLGAGFVLSLILIRFMSSLLYGVEPNDPLAYAAVAAAITLVVSVACFLPARRATMVDPLVALRAE
jgi:predicted permease